MGTLRDGMIKWACENKMPVNVPEKTNNKTVQKEKLSTKDIKELMGQYQPTYRRSKGGAIRQK